MNQSNGTSLWVWLTLGLIGLGLNALAGQDISARIKARPALELPGGNFELAATYRDN